MVGTASGKLFWDPVYRNSGLFSDHYLETILPESTGWEDLVQEASPVRERVRKILADYTPTDIEAQAEEDLIRPVLRELGHEAFEVQPGLSTPFGMKRPDYVLYKDQQALQANKNLALDEERLAGKAYAVGDAKAWERALDVSSKGPGSSQDAFSNQNPSFQISFYMRHSGVEWGILTNGRRWRMYHRDTAHRLDHFYEVDLQAALESDEIEDFLYFYVFFRRAAFKEGLLSAGAILEESAEYARGVGESLKEQVFEALRHLAQGFIDYPQNDLSPAPDTLREIYDGSLIALYRMLFVLYAEARGLLPVAENTDYRESFSLYDIKHKAAGNLDRGRNLLPTSATLWPRLKELFTIINEGSPPLSVATFNGGLFDPERHPFLERYTVGDLHLQQAVDQLSRVAREFVDYRDLAERHLGTVYEGLLEFHLEPAGADIPDAAVAAEGWTVDLVNDSGQRHATGSYYTPDYIVRYIVDQTVRPMLEEAVEGKSTAAEKIQAVLATDVLDPAMGSGHFLVEATEYIARFLVEIGVSQDADGEGEEGAEGAEGKESGEEQNTEASDIEAELAYWKRRVVQSCVYGVDLNPLAVELAKLSLWLATVARDKPLSFLDHHLRAGNSLVGSRVDDIGPGRAASKKGKKGESAESAGGELQLSLVPNETFKKSMSTAVEEMWRIEGNPAETVAEVKEQERLYAELKETLANRYSRFLDLSALSRLEPARKLEQDAAAWRLLAQYLSGESDRLPGQVEGWLEEAQAASDEHGFLHWELEFPEVFFDRQGQPLGSAAGFDAVIGNPPYIQSKHFQGLKPYLQTAYPRTYAGKADLYVYFFGLGLEKAKAGGRLGYISSGLFSKLEYGAPLRNLLTTGSTLTEIVEFGEEQVFEGAITYPIIVALKNELPPEAATVGLKGPADLAQNTLPEQNPVPREDDIWAFTAEPLQHIIRGWDGSSPLEEVLGSSIYSGIKTNLNDAFLLSDSTKNALVSKDPASEDLIKPFVRGEGLRPWYHSERVWLLLLPLGWTREAFGEGLEEQTAWGCLKSRYPAVAEHLAPFAQAGRRRTDKGEYWWELRSCNYYSAFEQPRIHSTKVSYFPTFSFSEEIKYALNTSYVLPIADTEVGNYLLGILNSRVCEFYCRKVFAPKANGYFEIQPGELARFPIPEASDEEKAAVAEIAEKATGKATERHELHRRAQRRILTDFGTAGSKLNQKLTRWWELDFSGFRAEIKKAFKQDIPVGERDDWDEWLASRRSERERLTGEIVGLEKSLNDRVYSLFGLSPEEIKIVEESTRYRYGEV